MLLTLPAILNSEEIAVARDLIAKGQFIDGKLSAGREAVKVKNNMELDAQDQLITPLNNLVMGKLVQNSTYQNAALPAKIAAPYYARYSTGMSYGNHVDDPVMGPTGQRYRSDISMTVFLSAPDEYDGGELIIQSTFGEQQIKLAAGDAVMYPSSSTHRVAEVTRGERLVAVTWCQSMIRDAAQRELLYNLCMARDALIAKDPTGESTQRVSNTYTNLVRMWSEL